MAARRAGVMLHSVRLHEGVSRLRGLRLLQGVRTGEVLVQVPRTAMLGTESDHDSIYADAPNKDAKELIDLAVELLSKRVHRGENISLKHAMIDKWFDCLPSPEELATQAWSAAYFNEAELAAMSLSPAASSSTNAAWAVHELLHGSFPFSISELEARWAVHSVLSRRVSWRDVDGRAAGPIATPLDFVNHGVHANVQLSCFPGGGCVMRASRPIRAGEELLWSYTSGSNVTFLSIFGFAPQGNDVALAVGQVETGHAEKFLRAVSCPPGLIGLGVVSFSATDPSGLDDAHRVCLELLEYISEAARTKALLPVLANIQQKASTTIGGMKFAEIAKLLPSNATIRGRLRRALIRTCARMSERHTESALVALNHLRSVEDSRSRQLSVALDAEVHALRRCSMNLRIV